MRVVVSARATDKPHKRTVNCVEIYKPLSTSLSQHRVRHCLEPYTPCVLKLHHLTSIVWFVKARILPFYCLHCLVCVCSVCCLCEFSETKCFVLVAVQSCACRCSGNWTVSTCLWHVENWLHDNSTHHAMTFPSCLNAVGYQQILKRSPVSTVCISHQTNDISH